MLCHANRIQEEISDAVLRLEETGSQRIEIGLVNLSNTDSSLLDMANGRGFRVYAIPHNISTWHSLDVPFVEALNAFYSLKNQLKARGIEVVEGAYEYPFKVE